MRRMYSRPGEYRKILLANYLCIGFVPAGTHSGLDKTSLRPQPHGLFYPLLGWGLALSRGEHNSSQHRPEQTWVSHCLGVKLPGLLSAGSMAKFLDFGMVIGRRAVRISSEEYGMLTKFQIGGKKAYTKGVFSSENASASIGKKKRFGVYHKACFHGKKRRIIHIHQRAFKVFVGDPFAQHWCIDFGLLS